MLWKSTRKERGTEENRARQCDGPKLSGDLGRMRLSYLCPKIMQRHMTSTYISYAYIYGSD